MAGTAVRVDRMYLDGQFLWIRSCDVEGRQAPCGVQTLSRYTSKTARSRRQTAVAITSRGRAWVARSESLSVPSVHNSCLT